MISYSYKSIAIPDGFTSATILIDYLKQIKQDVNIEWRVHEGKEHGVILETVPEDAKLVIIPDAGSNQFEEHKRLHEQGIDVIILDHHECNEESQYAIVVNSQLSPEYTNKQLTGAGIAYKFCKGLDETLGINIADNYLDLVALGNISDMADIREPETRYYIIEGLKRIKNPLFKALYDKQEYSTKGVISIVNTQFYITPLINACIRVGTEEDKVDMMKAFLGHQETVHNSRTQKDETFPQYVARTLSNLKNKQGRLRDKGAEDIKARVLEKKLDENKVLIVDVDGLLDKNLTGLVANRLLDTYQRPIILVRFNKDTGLMKGSARGYEKSGVSDFKQLLTDSGLFDFCEGHKNAFGVGIEPEKLIQARDYLNDLLSDMVIDTDTYDVDFVVSEKSLSTKLILEIDSMKDLWGYKVEEPLIAFTGITVNADDVEIKGKKEDTIKFMVKDIEFIAFRQDSESINELNNNKGSITLEIVGRCSINEYEGKQTPQVIIEAFEVKSTQKKKFVF